MDQVRILKLAAQSYLKDHPDCSYWVMGTGARDSSGRIVRGPYAAMLHVTYGIYKSYLPLAGLWDRDWFLATTIASAQLKYEYDVEVV